MAKKKKSDDQTPPATQKEHSHNNKDPELTLDTQQEINANLEMIIRNLKLTNSSDDDDDCDYDCDDSTTSDSDNDCAANTNTGSSSTSTTQTSSELGIVFPPIKTTGFNAFLTCVDLFIFELDEKVIEKLIFCAILSMSLDVFLKKFKSTFLPLPSSILKKFGNQLDEKIATTYNQFILKVMTDIQMTENKREYLQNLFQSHLMTPKKKNKLLNIMLTGLQKILFQETEAQTLSLEHIDNELEQTVRTSTLSFLYNHFAIKFNEFQAAVGLKVTCLEEDLVFLSSEILRFTSLEAGILPLSNALNVAIASRFAEDDEFDEIFDAVEELADTIEELAEIYQDRLKVLRALLPFASCPRPVVVPPIPEVPIIDEEL